MRLALCALLLVGCPKAGAPEEDPVRTSPLADVQWMTGHWLLDGGGSETWMDVGHALVGVAFAAGEDPAGFEALRIDDRDGLAFTAWPSGGGGTRFAAREHEAGRVVFANPRHDFPQTVRYWRDGETLRAEVAGPEGANPLAFAWSPGALPPAPALEAADRAFAADTAEHGAAGWASWFDEEGAMWGDGERIEGRAAIEAAMAGVFGGGLAIEWAPTHSGSAPGGHLGFTVGDYVTTRDGEPVTQGVYTSIWRLQADGSWRVFFDVGSPR